MQTNEKVKKKLEKEKENLNSRMEALRTFIQSDEFSEIDSVQMTLLNVQLKAMETYSQCLLERIIRL